MAKIQALVDADGRIVAAEFGADSTRADKDAPSAQLLAMPGQRHVHVEVPDEIEHLSGPDLTHFFSHVEVMWSAEVATPRVEVVNLKHDESG